MKSKTLKELEQTFNLLSEKDKCFIEGNLEVLDEYTRKTTCFSSFSDLVSEETGSYHPALSKCVFESNTGSASNVEFLANAYDKIMEARCVEKRACIVG